MSKWLIIGSTAAYHWFSESRKPADIDLLTPAKIKSDNLSDCFIDTQWHDAAEYLLSINQDAVFADPNVLFTLKVSHAHWAVKWDKTISDISFLQRRGCTLLPDLYNKLVPVWSEIHGRSKVHMNKPVSEFFNDAVIRKYSHEHLHELVSFGDRPLHERIRKDLSTALCSKELFNALSEEEQLQCALEEIIVTAIERKNLVHSDQNSTKSLAMSAAHRKLCTSMSTGWFSLFLILNRDKLLFMRRELWQAQMQKCLMELNYKD
jgi:hypothetical protein